MLKAGLKTLSLGLLVAFSTATSSFAQVSTVENLKLAQASKFTCAPNLRTYVVRPLDNRQGFGIRCVKFSKSTNASTTPRLAWYGEGNWGGSTYRHLGHAFGQSQGLVGYASDIHGNGENINNNFPGNLKVQIISGSIIRVTGAWNEEWRLVNSTNYNPLPRPRTCGNYLDEYKVADLNGQRQGSGLRCVLKEQPPQAKGVVTWFGNGNWGGNTYSHLGTLSASGWGAGDICDTPFGPICNNFPYGSLNISSHPGGYKVTGAWSEKWHK